jgi:glycosyltransferase involved in cell wall biosynthesis
MRHIYNAVETFFEESFRRFADGTTVISTALFDRATNLGVPADGIRIIPQGCDPIASDRATREEARAALNIGADDVIFITVGVLNTSDADLLFKTVPIVRSKMPSAKFFIIGRNRARVPASLAGESVYELGYVPDETLSFYLSCADALVVPLADTLSSRARWPSKVNSALTHDLPVVVTRVGDLPRLLQRRGAAFVASPDPESFAETILEAATNRSLVDGVKTAAKSVATEVLPWSTVIDNLEAYYYEVLSART